MSRKQPQRSNFYTWQCHNISKSAGNRDGSVPFESMYMLLGHWHVLSSGAFAIPHVFGCQKKAVPWSTFRVFELGMQMCPNLVLQKSCCA